MNEINPPETPKLKTKQAAPFPATAAASAAASAAIKRELERAGLLVPSSSAVPSCPYLSNTLKHNSTDLTLLSNNLTHYAVQLISPYYTIRTYPTLPYRQAPQFCEIS